MSNRVVWKFVLPIQDTSSIEMPEGANVLCVDKQHSWVCVWALCDPTAPLVERQFLIHGTGHPMNGHEGNYLGTVIMASNDLVWHIWEKS